MSAPVMSVAQMRQWEQASWDAGCSQSEVIHNAGRSVADAALKLTNPNDFVLILAGKGHNGDDARCAKPHLADRRVEILEVKDPAQTRSALETHLRQKPTLIIDGLFGIGLSRPLDDSWADFIDRINQQNARVLAVDVPSGLNADSGEPQNVAICAHTTVTFGAPKNGLLTPKAHTFVGRLQVAADIGLIPCPISSGLLWTDQDDFASYPPSRRVDGHKGTYGHVAILAGSAGYHGAAVLAARGALRARPGLVTVICDSEVYLPIASQLQAAMVHRFLPPVALPASCTAIVIGPGLASPKLDASWRNFANEQWQSSPFPVVVDASALEWIEKGPTPLNSRRVITPHPGEAARLLGSRADAVQSDRVRALRELSNRYGNCWVVLKGHQTLVGRSSGEVFVNSTGNPYLAQGGAGDVLAGFMGGLLAQSRLQAQPLKAIRFAVWRHGAAADSLAEQGGAWTIEELLHTLGA